MFAKKKKTPAVIIAPLMKMVDELQDLISENFDEVIKTNDEIKSLELKRESTENDSRDALRIIKALRGVTGQWKI